jgi:tRNA A37 threonylcarbamoyladenosine synthetase subunit TsaC/SUA5/YrdC
VIRLSGLPLTATSANLSGASECTTADAVREQLRDRLPVIIDGGPSPREVASTIVDLSGDYGTWHVQREGAIPAQEIAKALGEGAQSAD